MPLSEILQHVSKLDILKLLPPPDAENAGQNCPGDITTWNIDLLIEYALVGARIPSNYLVYMVNLSKQILVTEPNLVSITTDKPVYIIGDIHGSFHDMLQIFEQTGLPNQDSYFIFLGDIVDRGFYGVEALCLLTLFKIKYPSNVFIIRGNHESRGSTQVYGFYQECVSKYGSGREDRGTIPPPQPFRPASSPMNAKKAHILPSLPSTSSVSIPSLNTPQSTSTDALSTTLPVLPPPVIPDLSPSILALPLGEHPEGPSLYKHFMCMFDALPIAVVVNDSLFCVHGGLSPSIEKLTDIQCIDRFVEVPAHGPLSDLLWSDPDDSISQYFRNARGNGVTFGRTIVSNFLKTNSLSVIIRSHQLAYQGFSVACDRVMTVWSAPNYCGRFNNKACFLRVATRAPSTDSSAISSNTVADNGNTVADNSNTPNSLNSAPQAPPSSNTSSTHSTSNSTSLSSAASDPLLEEELIHFPPIPDNLTFTLFPIPACPAPLRAKMLELASEASKRLLATVYVATHPYRHLAGVAYGGASCDTSSDSSCNRSMGKNESSSSGSNCDPSKSSSAGCNASMSASNGSDALSSSAAASSERDPSTEARNNPSGSPESQEKSSQPFENAVMLIKQYFDAPTINLPAFSMTSSNHVASVPVTVTVPPVAVNNNEPTLSTSAATTTTNNTVSIASVPLSFPADSPALISTHPAALSTSSSTASGDSAASHVSIGQAADQSSGNDSETTSVRQIEVSARRTNENRKPLPICGNENCKVHQAPAALLDISPQLSAVLSTTSLKTVLSDVPPILSSALPSLLPPALSTALTPKDFGPGTLHGRGLPLSTHNAARNAPRNSATAIPFLTPTAGSGGASATSAAAGGGGGGNGQAGLWMYTGGVSPQHPHTSARTAGPLQLTAASPTSQNNDNNRETSASSSSQPLTSDANAGNTTTDISKPLLTPHASLSTQSSTHSTASGSSQPHSLASTPAGSPQSRPRFSRAAVGFSEELLSRLPPHARYGLTSSPSVSPRSSLYHTQLPPGSGGLSADMEGQQGLRGRVMYGSRGGAPVATQDLSSQPSSSIVMTREQHAANIREQHRLAILAYQQGPKPVQRRFGRSSNNLGDIVAKGGIAQGGVVHGVEIDMKKTDEMKQNDDKREGSPSLGENDHEKRKHDNNDEENELKRMRVADA